MSEPRKEVLADGIEIWLGDCRDVIGLFPPCFRVHAVVTDPPYGVAFKGSATRHSLRDGNSYLSFDDTPENVAESCVPVIESCRLIARTVVLTPGIANSRLYPKPDGEGVIWYPSGANSGPFGFITHQPIFYYGKCPFLANGKGSFPTGFSTTEAAEQNGHPCPKPIGQMKWLVHRASLQGETVLDPFMGSGTTGVACVNLGRSFIGIEREPKYFGIARRRISEALAQPRLAFDEPIKPKQESLAL